MPGISKVISESLYNKAKEALKEVARSGDASRKLQAIKSALITASLILMLCRTSIRKRRCYYWRVTIPPPLSIWGGSR